MVEEKTGNLFDKIKNDLPSSANIADIRFEGCEIILYTKSKDFFTGDPTPIKKLVSKYKKRLKLRPDPSICLDMEKAEKIIRKLIPKEAGLKELNFEPEFGKITIEAEKPGIVIGKGGETLREIKKETLWFPQVKRAPAIPSDIVKTLRNLIFKESAFRKDFLNKVGKRIHGGWRETEWARISCLGGCREVGRSCFLLQTPESRILLDCGVKPGSNEPPYLTAPEFDINNLDAIVISHAHLDHCALVPLLYKMGYTGPLYCTYPTRDLMVLLWMDYIEVVQKQGKNAPYDTKAIKEAIKRTICLEYDEVSDITPDMRLTLLNSGHIMGGSLCHIHIGNGFHNLLYTGDIKFDRTALFEPASLNFKRAETIITESTYGSMKDIQPRRAETEQKLIDTCKNTIKRGGKVLIPSFAVERAQDLMVILQGAGITVPIYLDGMVWDATAIHTTYPEYMNRNLQKKIMQGDNPFTDKAFKRIAGYEERKDAMESEEPCVVIATSGMLIGGPSISWLQHLAGDPKNTIVFVGYQAEGTLGKRIQKGWKEVPMEEKGRTKTLPVNMEIITIEGLSGHSDIKQLRNYIAKLKQIPEKIIVNHGDPKKCVEFARMAHKMFRTETIAPRLLDAIRLK